MIVESQVRIRLSTCCELAFTCIRVGALLGKHEVPCRNTTTRTCLQSCASFHVCADVLVRDGQTQVFAACHTVLTHRCAGNSSAMLAVQECSTYLLFTRKTGNTITAMLADHYGITPLPLARTPTCALCGSCATSALQRKRVADFDESHARVQTNIKQAHEYVQVLLDRLRCAKEEIRQLRQVLARAERCSADEAACAQTMRETLHTQNN